MSRNILTFKNITLALAAAALTAMTTGCGIGDATPSQLTSASSLSGIVHGGPNPVTGATVKLYSTGTGSYGAAGTLLGTATTDSNGNFTFSGASTCTTPSQVYITAYGGNPGAGANTNYLLMAALGDCSTVNTSSVIWVNEVTTVAAAYALSNFISISGTTVSVGAPTNIATGVCTGTGAGQACTTAGLKHAFQNALNLASSIGTAGTPPTGQAYTTTPSNTTGTVPALLLGTVADALQVCVNSTGGTASDTSTPCGKLFSYTTPPQISSTVPSAPTNTLQAAIDIAKYPNLTGATAVANLFALPGGFTTYYPGLTASTNLHDFSLAIVYKGASTATFAYPYFVSLDTNDNAYVIYQASSSATTAGVAAMTSNGTPIWADAAFTTSGCAAGVPCLSAPDAASTPTLWLASGSTSAGKLWPITASSGVVGTALTATSAAFGGVAIDKSNDVYVSNPIASANSIYALAAGGSSLSAVQANSANISTTTVPLWIALDGSSNLWIADKYTAGTASVVSEATGQASVTSYTNAVATQTVSSSAQSNGGVIGVTVTNGGSGYTTAPTVSFTGGAGSGAAGTATVSGGVVTGVTITAEGTAYTSAPTVVFTPTSGGTGATAVADEGSGDSGLYGLVLNSSGTAFANNGAKLFTIPAGNASLTSTTVITDGTAFASSARYSAIDGHANIFMPDNNSSSSYTWQYLPPSGSYAGGFFSILPCAIVTATTTCATGNTSGAGQAVYGPRNAAIDSTGSIWVASSTNGNVVQIIGTAAPTYGQLSYLKPGVTP